MDTIFKNEIYNLIIDSYSSDARGIAHLYGRAVFVPDTIVGEEWKVLILKVTSSEIYAKGLELISSSAERETADCQYYRYCGGCQTRHMSYEEELRMKTGIIRDAFHSIAGKDIIIEETAGADSRLRYRNKAIYSLSCINGETAAGFYRNRTHDTIAVSDCLIQNRLCAVCTKAVVDFMNCNGIKPYDEMTCTGTVRHIYCRNSVYDNSFILCLVCNGGLGSKTQEFVKFMLSSCPELTGIVININKNSGNTVLGDKEFTLWGKSTLTEMLCGYTFDFSLKSFFQVNPEQAEKLFNIVRSYCGSENKGTAIELYCGTGTISIIVSNLFKSVLSCEIVPEAVENAKNNAIKNSVSNISFICCDAGEAAQKALSDGIMPDTVIVDPPRSGMDQKAINAIIKMNPEKLIYVSCNPATLARDCRVFFNHGYNIANIKAVDMFPGSYHIETAALLTRL